MANHKSAEKRARQTIKKTARNAGYKSRIHTAKKKVLEAKDEKTATEALSKGFQAIQKARGILHKNTIKRKMSRLAKAAARVKKAS